MTAVVRRFVVRLVNFVRGGRADDRVRAELDEHLTLLTEEYIRAGLPVEEARRRARIRLGSTDAAIEAYRDVAGWPGLDALWQDVRSAMRANRRTPGLAVAIVVTLGLAIGANAAVFSLLHALALRELPVRDPATLVHVSTVAPVLGDGHVTFPMFRELANQQSVFTAMIGAWGTSVLLVGDDKGAVRGLVWAATGNLYEELGLQPAAGRLLVPDDMTIEPPSADRVAVLGYGFWQRHYGGDPSVVGRSIQIEAAPFTVVGVAPPGFTGLGLVTEPDVTVPLPATPLLSGASPSTLATSASRSVRAIGRLKSGVTIDQARAQLAAVWPGVLAGAVPPAYTGRRRSEFLSLRLDVTSASTGIEQSLRSRFVQPLVILLGISGLVLLIACTNVVSLLLSRARARQREIGVRLALGGGRWRVARQLMIEGVVLALAGAVAGVVCSFWACAVVTALVFEELTVPVAFDGSPDATVLAVAAGVAVAVGVCCSALPAWRATRVGIGEVLGSQSRTVSTGGRSVRSIVGVQLALTVVLLATAGVLLRSLSELRALSTGIDRSDDVIVAYPRPAHPRGYEGLDNDAYYLQVIQRIEAVPGVERASASLLKPGTGGGFRDVVARLSGTDEATGVTATRSPVSPGFFAAVGVAVTRGRDFEWRDNSSGSRVTILSQSLASRLFGDGDPIGHRVRVGLDPSRDALEVIGVVADARLYDLRSPDLLAVYTPALQDESASYKCFVIRGGHVSVAALGEAVESLGREQLGDVVTLRHITERSLLVERLVAMISSAFGSVVLLLAAIGLFGMMSYAVAQRGRDIGIRMALGADKRRIVMEVVSEGVAVTLAGCAIGGAAALMALGGLRPLLFGIAPQDPLTLGTVASVLMVVAMLACVVPAWRAARIDPIVALRLE